MIWLLANWKLVAVAALIAVLCGYGLTMKSQRDAVTVEFSDYRRTIAIAAQAAAEQALKKTIADEKRKEESDVENVRLRAALDAATRRLRDARASSSFVPPAAPNAPSPADATFQRAELERALRTLDSGIQELVDEGSKAVIDLDTAKRWAQER